MRRSEIKKKARQLRDGQIVELNADWFRAKPIDVEFAAERCNYCDLDCICLNDICDTCEWLNIIANRFYCLTLAHK